MGKRCPTYFTLSKKATSMGLIKTRSAARVKYQRTKLPFWGNAHKENISHTGAYVPCRFDDHEK